MPGGIGRRAKKERRVMTAINGVGQATSLGSAGRPMARAGGFSVDGAAGGSAAAATGAPADITLAGLLALQSDEGDEMRDRLQEFALSLHPEKTRLIEFGRHAGNNRKQGGLGKPETFNFLGMTFLCGKSRGGKFLLKRRTRCDRMQAKIKEVAGNCDGGCISLYPSKVNG